MKHHADEKHRQKASKVQAAIASKYTIMAFAKDVKLPLADMGSDGVNLIAYIIDVRRQFVTLVAAAMVFNGALTTCVLAIDGHRPMALVLSLATCGVPWMIIEANKSQTTGFKTSQLHFFKFAEAFEAMVSFFIAVYTLLIAGFLDAYNLPKSGWQLAVRCLSAATSCVTLPMATDDLTVYRLLDKRAHGSN